MEKLKFNECEVLCYLEQRIIDDLATTEEQEAYENYKWTGKLDKMNYTYNTILRNMKKQYEGGF